MAIGGGWLRPSDCRSASERVVAGQAVGAPTVEDVSIDERSTGVIRVP